MVNMMQPAEGRVGTATNPDTGNDTTVYISKNHGADRFTVTMSNGDSWLLNGSEISNIRRPIL